jgi:hypothetical protein
MRTKDVSRRIPALQEQRGGLYADSFVRQFVGYLEPT